MQKRHFAITSFCHIFLSNDINSYYRISAFYIHYMEIALENFVLIYLNVCRKNNCISQNMTNHYAILLLKNITL